MSVQRMIFNISIELQQIKIFKEEKKLWNIRQRFTTAT